MSERLAIEKLIEAVESIDTMLCYKRKSHGFDLNRERLEDALTQARQELQDSAPAPASPSGNEVRGRSEGATVAAEQGTVKAGDSGAAVCRACAGRGGGTNSMGGWCVCERCGGTKREPAPPPAVTEEPPERDVKADLLAETQVQWTMTRCERDEALARAEQAETERAKWKEWCVAAEAQAKRYREALCDALELAEAGWNLATQGNALPSERYAWTRNFERLRATLDALPGESE